MGNFITWGVVGVLTTSSVAFIFGSFYFEPERKQKRRAKANQRWVREALVRHNVTGVIQEAETIAAFYKQMEDPWTFLGSK